MLKCVFGDAITTRCLFDCLNRRSVSSEYSWVLLAVFTLINAMTCRILLGSGAALFHWWGAELSN